MLILTRRVGEKVMVGHDIVFTILGVKGSQVRLGIDAPKDVDVVREELLTEKEVRAFETRISLSKLPVLIVKR